MADVNVNNHYELDSEEQDILEAYNSGRLQGDPVSSGMVAAAAQTLRKNKNINIRIPENDLESLKILAAREGMPYQTLIGSILHKYVVGSV